jgi:RNAse (barnase) inhibitor barstar
MSEHRDEFYKNHEYYVKLQPDLLMEEYYVRDIKKIWSLAVALTER